MELYEEFSKSLVKNEPNLPDVEDYIELVRQIWERNWLTNDGPLVRQLEMELATVTEAKHVVAVANGTLALMIAAKVLGIDGDFICPSFTFVATAHALHWQGGNPIFCDITPNGFNLDPERVWVQRHHLLTGIVATQVFGTPLDSEIKDIADEYHIPLLVDSAHTLGCSLPIIGDAEILSLHATKVAHSCEGGAILTNDPDLADSCRLMRRFGFAGHDTVITEGINAKMSELHAAMGLLSLRDLDAQIAHNREEYLEYEKGLRGVSGVLLCETGANYHYVPVIADDRDTLTDYLLEKGILARKYFTPGCHRCEPYLAMSYPNFSSLPNTEALCDEILILPNHSAGKVCSIIKEFYS